MRSLRRYQTKLICKKRFRMVPKTATSKSTSFPGLTSSWFEKRSLNFFAKRRPYSCRICSKKSQRSGKIGKGDFGRRHISLSRRLARKYCKIACQDLYFDVEGKCRKFDKGSPF